MHASRREVQKSNTLMCGTGVCAPPRDALLGATPKGASRRRLTRLCYRRVIGRRRMSPCADIAKAGVTETP